MKNTTRFGAVRFGALALLFGLAACSGVSANGDSPAAAAPAGQMHQGLWQKIQAEIGSAACDNGGQCRTMPVGHKSCGGPEGYAAYSTKSGDSKRLMALGEQYAAARKAENERSGMLSNCMMESDPGASCVASRCVLNKGGAGVSVE
ncbi:hypothetical protein HHL21_17010 [Massilia sp. RP-1-19]|uniref:DUF4189 domain-containing protein n=1 Tax=Massilia polaris TaxID=2728846 RepID=A0A848HRM0_9BURK|nr:hypothetical protein [Massilia polaris]NML62749.1 hypothetical protein [Massilia polaris]